MIEMVGRWIDNKWKLMDGWMDRLILDGGLMVLMDW